MKYKGRIQTAHIETSPPPVPSFINVRGLAFGRGKTMDSNPIINFSLSVPATEFNIAKYTPKRGFVLELKLESKS